MGKSRVRLAWIPDESKRRATYRKRKVSLLKKICELCILCAVPGCMVLYGPSGDSTAVTWPDPAEATRLVMRFLGLPEMERTKKMLNQEEFVRQRIQKVLQQFSKAQRDIRDLNLEHLLNQWMAYGSAVATSAGFPALGAYVMKHDMDVTNGLGLDEINSFVHLLDRKLWISAEKLQRQTANQPTAMDGADSLQPPLPLFPAPAPPVMEPPHVDTAVERGLSQTELGSQVELKLAEAVTDQLDAASTASAAMGGQSDAFSSQPALITEFFHHAYFLDQQSPMLECLMPVGSQEPSPHQEGSASSQFQHLWSPEPPVQLWSPVDAMMLNPPLFEIDGTDTFHDASTSKGLLGHSPFVSPEDNGSNGDTKAEVNKQ